jgi:hypothetical protein
MCAESIWQDHVNLFSVIPPPPPPATRMTVWRLGPGGYSHPGAKGIRDERSITPPRIPVSNGLRTPRPSNEFTALLAYRSQSSLRASPWSCSNLGWYFDQSFEITRGFGEAGAWRRASSRLRPHRDACIGNERRAFQHSIAVAMVVPNPVARCATIRAGDRRN